MQSQLDAMRAVERAKVAAGEAGVSGSTVDMLLNDYEAQRLRATTTINANLDNIEKQIELQKLGASSEAQSRINSIRQGRQPSFLAYRSGYSCQPLVLISLTVLNLQQNTNLSLVQDTMIPIMILLVLGLVTTTSLNRSR